MDFEEDALLKRSLSRPLDDVIEEEETVVLLILSLSYEMLLVLLLSVTSKAEFLEAVIIFLRVIVLEDGMAGTEFLWFVTEDAGAVCFGRVNGDPENLLSEVSESVDEEESDSKTRDCLGVVQGDLIQGFVLIRLLSREGVEVEEVEEEERLELEYV